MKAALSQSFLVRFDQGKTTDLAEGLPNHEAPKATFLPWEAPAVPSERLWYGSNSRGQVSALETAGSPDGQSATRLGDRNCIRHPPHR
jgi:hypothetical protein